MVNERWCCQARGICHTFPERDMWTEDYTTWHASFSTALVSTLEYRDDQALQLAAFPLTLRNEYIMRRSVPCVAMLSWTIPYSTSASRYTRYVSYNEPQTNSKLSDAVPVNPEFQPESCAKT